MIGQQNNACLDREIHVQAQSVLGTVVYIHGVGLRLITLGSVDEQSDTQSENPGTPGTDIAASGGGRYGAHEKSGTEKEESGQETGAED